jgi:hypothetical protein
MSIITYYRKWITSYIGSQRQMCHHQFPDQNIFVPLYSFFFFSTQIIHIKPVKHKRIAMFSLKNLYPGGIRTRVFCCCPLRHDPGLNWNVILTTVNAQKFGAFNISPIRKITIKTNLRYKFWYVFNMYFRLSRNSKRPSSQVWQDWV